MYHEAKTVDLEDKLAIRSRTELIHSLFCCIVVLEEVASVSVT